MHIYFIPFKLITPRNYALMPKFYPILKTLKKVIYLWSGLDPTLRQFLSSQS